MRVSGKALAAGSVFSPAASALPLTTQDLVWMLHKDSHRRDHLHATHITVAAVTGCLFAFLAR